ANWALSVATEAEFVRQILEGQPEPPAYFAQMKRLNRDGPPARPKTRPPRLPGDTLPALLRAGSPVVDTRKTADFAKGHLRGTLVDVRKQSEWDEGHIAGAIHIPLGDVAARAAEIPADRPVVLHCEGGGRSAIAASVLRKMGRHDVMNLQGGISAWKKAGLPV